MDMPGEIARILGEGQGWDLLEQIGQRGSKDLERQREELRAEAAVLARPFKSPEGQAALQALVTRIICRPMTKPVEGYTLEQQALYAAQREGQAQVLAMIFNALAVDRGQEPKLSEGQAT